VGLTVKPCMLEHDFRSTAEFRSYRDCGLTEHKAHGIEFPMLGARSGLRLSHAE